MQGHTPGLYNGNRGQLEDNLLAEKLLGARVQRPPSSPVRIRQPSFRIRSPSSALVEGSGNITKGDGEHVIRKAVLSSDSSCEPGVAETRIEEPAQDLWQLRDASNTLQRKQVNPISTSNAIASLRNGVEITIQADVDAHHTQPQEPAFEQLQYHHVSDAQLQKRRPGSNAGSSRPPSLSSISNTLSSSVGSKIVSHKVHTSSPDAVSSLPVSAVKLESELHDRGRSSASHAQVSESHSLSPNRTSRNSSGPSPDRSKRASQTDLLKIPYAQQMTHHSLAMDNAQLRGSVGESASLLDVGKTLQMYRANVRKTNDPAIQYEFAVFMVNVAQETPLSISSERQEPPRRGPDDRTELLNEAKQILQKLADRTYIYAQYYLGDGYFSGLFNKGKQDYDRALPLFVSAGKHGHAEAAYRAALCYEYAWGSRRDYQKAVQYYRMAATKNHPGASTRLGLACLSGEMGLAGRYREGVTWLKRATESADEQHNQAPYELGLLHIHGYGDDIFKDESYSAQLFTRAAELGHAEASLRMGEAYEHGILSCPKDPALSIHFYTGAAQGGIAKAMMALCAWYMVGAEPVLQKDEAEAYEWAKRAAEQGKVALCSIYSLLN